VRATSHGASYGLTSLFFLRSFSLGAAPIDIKSKANITPVPNIISSFIVDIQPLVCLTEIIDNAIEATRSVVPLAQQRCTLGRQHSPFALAPSATRQLSSDSSPSKQMSGRGYTPPQQFVGTT
jgi:hypothetical protein